MQAKKIFQSRSVKKDTSTSSMKQERPSDKTSLSSKYYLNITELPLRNFIDCIVNNNIYSLIISGHPDVNDLYLQWHEISQQYADAIGDNDHRMYAIMLRDYTITCANYELIQRGIQILKIVHHPEICNKINKILSTSLKFNATDQKAYDNDLKTAWRRSKAFKIKSDLLKVSLDNMGGDKVVPSKEYFARILIALSDKAGFYLTDSITTFEFCERIKQFNAYHDNLKNGKK